MKHFFKSIVFLVLIGCISFSNLCLAKDFDPKDYAVYTPNGIDLKVKYPVIIGFSPSGNGLSVVNTLQKIADEKKCFIIASNQMRNGADPIYILEQFTQDLAKVFSKKLPIDLKKTVAFGMSGGGMASHLYSFLYPGIISAVITDVGCINEFARSQSEAYPKNKICVFLASPTDFNYSIMKIDLDFLQKHNWNCKWIEFEGGHITASQDKLKEAFEYVLSEFNKK